MKKDYFGLAAQLAQDQFVTAPKLAAFIADMTRVHDVQKALDAYKAEVGPADALRRVEFEAAQGDGK